MRLPKHKQLRRRKSKACDLPLLQDPISLNNQVIFLRELVFLGVCRGLFGNRPLRQCLARVRGSGSLSSSLPNWIVEVKGSTGLYKNFGWENTCLGRKAFIQKPVDLIHAIRWMNRFHRCKAYSWMSALIVGPCLTCIIAKFVDEWNTSKINKKTIKNLILVFYKIKQYKNNTKRQKSLKKIL